MLDSSSPMRAAIDIGSNTIHIVVARCSSDDLDIVADELELVRIGESVTATGEISSQKQEMAIETLCRYRDLTEQHGAEPILAVATEAIRQARNSREFLEQIEQQTGIHVHLISGNAEATFTFIGSTYGPDLPTHIGVMDLGGGSLELVTAKGREINWQTSVPIGSGWLHDRYLPANPPTTEDIRIARTFLDSYFRAIEIKEQPALLVVTGGSANSLLYLARQVSGLDEQQYELKYEDLQRCETLLSTTTAEEIAQRYNQPVARARILLSGTLIIRAVMARLNLGEIRVSPHGIREGVLLVYQRMGERWLEYADSNAHATPSTEGENPKQAEDFLQYGRDILQEYTEKMLSWQKEVLKDEDIEAVHKMRVASRRLRAILDAYEGCCPPRQFKKVYRRIKEITDMLGTARETDVMIAGLQSQLEQLPLEEQAGTSWLIQRLKTYRQQQQSVLENFFKDLDEHWLVSQLASLLPEGVAAHGKS